MSVHETKRGKMRRFEYLAVTCIASLDYLSEDYVTSASHNITIRKSHKHKILQIGILSIPYSRHKQAKFQCLQTMTLY
jgi:hypothetical protein